MTQRWLQDIDTALARGPVGLELVFNTADLVADPEDGRYRRLREAIAVVFARRGYQVISVSATTGAADLPLGDRHDAGIGTVPPDDPHALMQSLDDLLRNERQVVAIVDHADHLTPQGAGPGLAEPDQQLALEYVHDWVTDPSLRSRDNRVILISHQNALHELLRRAPGMCTVRMPLPDLDARLAFIERLETLGDDEGGAAFGSLQNGSDPKQAALASGGLRLADVEGMFRQSATTGTPLDLQTIRRRKSEALRQLGQDLIEVFEPSHGLADVVGLEHVTDFLYDILETRRLPDGLLFAGVPGVGKSYLVRALASELGYPCLALRSIRSRWVGESERNLERVLWLIENLAPCVVMIDEIDRTMGRRGEGASADGGTSERLLARLWEFMGETGKQRGVLWIGTTNRPDLLDVASLDRFDATVPFLHPTPAQIAELLPAVSAQLGLRLTDDVDLQRLVAAPQLRQVSVRALQQILRVAAWWSQSTGAPDGTVDAGSLEEAVDAYLPSIDPVESEFIALSTLRMVEFDFLLPWRSRSGVRDGLEVPDYVQPFITPTGRLDRKSLGERVDQLRLRRAGGRPPRARA